MSATKDSNAQPCEPASTRGSHIHLPTPQAKCGTTSLKQNQLLQDQATGTTTSDERNSSVMHAGYELVRLQSLSNGDHFRKEQRIPTHVASIELGDASHLLPNDHITIQNEDTSYLQRGMVDFDEPVNKKPTPQTLRWTSWMKLRNIHLTQRDGTKTMDRPHHWDLYGWRMGVFIGCCLSAFVLCCNFTLLLIAAGTNAGQDFGLDSVANLMVDEEHVVARWNQICHILINVLSTALLSASNYTMQVLTAPTREELDTAHRNKKWLEIGLLGLRNVTHIPRGRATLCFVLAASSLPLHLFYNASIFKISSHDPSTWSREGSRIQISFVFLGVVTASNVVKLAVMLIVLIADDSDYIVTLGDAASSYLERSESLTENKSLLYKDAMLANFVDAPLEGTYEQVWRPRSQRYFSSISRAQQWCTAVSATCLIVALLALTAKTKSSDKTIWHWGTASSGALALGSSDSSKKGILWNAWLCNLPQLFLSLFYLNINAICTLIASVSEWDGLATSRKGLRVTDPQGKQRSTYFLQLPYRWSIPLMTASIVLHWILSQTFFPVRSRYPDGYEEDGSQKWIENSAAGISFLSLVIFCTTLIIVVAVVSAMVLRRWTPHLPPAENCSLMISAACHPAPDEIDPQLETVQWGVADGNEHCSLSSKHVEPPMKDEVFF